MTAVKQVWMLVLMIGVVCGPPTSPVAAAEDLNAAAMTPVAARGGPVVAQQPLLAGLKVGSVAARFGREGEEEPLYVVRPPEWSHEPLDWVEPHRLVSATAFEEPTQELLAVPAPEASSLWERWRQRRVERRKRPASWFRYPFYFEKFTSLIRTDEPVHDQIHNGRGNLFGARLGWDFAPQWGVESRLGYLRSTMVDTVRPLLPSHENFLFWDASLLCYLSGDTRWRPFLLAGLGVVDVGFIDNQSVLWNQTLLTMPFGAGFKFRFTDHNAFRFEVLDNVVFGYGHGGNSRAMHDVAVSFAFERRFGRPHKTYFPQANGNYWSRCRDWWKSMSN